MTGCATNALLGIGSFMSLLLSLPPPATALALLKAGVEAASQGRFEQEIEIRTNDEIGMLAAAFNSMLGQLQDHTERIRHLAFFDSVTDLPNRIHVKEILGRAIASASPRSTPGRGPVPRSRPLQLINDTFGHDAGDLLPGGCQASDQLLARWRCGAGAAGALTRPWHRLRRGVHSSARSIAETPTLPRRAKNSILDQPFDLDGQTVVGTSIGIAIFPDDGDDPESC